MHIPEKQRPEILAPVGAHNQLLAAVRCGANAVYLGGKDFNARRNADNFDGLDLFKAVAYCHAHNVRVYVTVNTLITDRERENLEKEADAIAASGADAVIIQDMAALRLFREKYPDIERIASTQTAVHNVSGAKYLEDLGFQSIVLARELSLSEMEKICSAVSIKTEAFVHGAHCMSLSGACYLSSMLGGRSGNRGLCAQPCRLDWKCGTKHCALSLKDMSLIDHLLDMEKIGINTFKIEGRMKRPEYVAAAVTACKNALEGKPYDMDTLRAVFSRSGFTDGYLTGRRGRDMFGSRTKEDVVSAETALKKLSRLYGEEKQTVPLSGSFVLKEDICRLSLSDGKKEAQVSGPKPEKAINRPLSAELASKYIEKMGGTQYFLRDIEFDIEDGLTLPAAALNAMRRQALEQLDILSADSKKILPQPFEWSKSGVFAYKKMRPVLWARFYKREQINCEEYFDKIILPVYEINEELIAKYEDRLIAQLPLMLFPNDEEALKERLKTLKAQGLHGIWTDNIYGIEMAHTLSLELYGGFGLNILNTDSLAHYERDGMSAVCLSFEISAGAIPHLGTGISRGIAAYGALPLMHFRNCPYHAFGGCAKCGGKGQLTDRTDTDFPLECWDKKYSVLLNSLPLDIADKDISGIDFKLLYFTRESCGQVAQVTERFVRCQPSDTAHTGGLYYRKLL